MIISQINDIDIVSRQVSDSSDEHTIWHKIFFTSSKHLTNIVFKFLLQLWRLLPSFNRLQKRRGSIRQYIMCSFANYDLILILINMLCFKLKYFQNDPILNWNQFLNSTLALDFFLYNWKEMVERDSTYLVRVTIKKKSLFSILPC